tara:strand:- start:1185 stop:1571 length:387 start_codon:yes stop_codon:yes gene_type:complete
MASIQFRTESKFAAVTGNSASTTSSPDNATLLFTCPNNYEAEVVYLLVSNDQSSNSNIGIQIYHADNTEYRTLVLEEQITGRASTQFIGSGPLYLHAGDKVLIHRITSSHNFSAALSCRLYFSPANRT